MLDQTSRNPASSIQRHGEQMLDGDHNPECVMLYRTAPCVRNRRIASYRIRGHITNQALVLAQERKENTNTGLKHNTRQIKDRCNVMKRKLQEEPGCQTKTACYCALSKSGQCLLRARKCKHFESRSRGSSRADTRGAPAICVKISCRIILASAQ